ncbi:MAG: hypothetical protein KY445_04700, partial [Armatimonadetes bacterium]|nr:hypothetical protein [Armatimonadota bacterium]
TFKTTGATGKQVTAFVSKCAYEGAIGGESAMFEAESPANDKLLLPAWRPEIVRGQLVVLELGGAEKRFTVLDFVPVGVPATKTLVSITPKN